MTGTIAGDIGMMQAAWSACCRLLAMVGAALLLVGAAANAQEASPLPGQTALNLPNGQGRILRFSEPVESVLIADTTIADVQVVAPDVVYVYGLQPGVTNLIAITANKNIEASAQLRVTKDISNARRANRSASPTSSTDLTVVGNQLVLQGQAASVEDAMASEAVARSFSAPDQPPINNSVIQGSQQVNIRVRFAEVARSELQSYGVDWQIGYESSGFEIGAIGNNAVPTSSGGNLELGGNIDGFKFDVVIEALKRNGIVKILAEPNLTAVSGQTASFLAGGEIPIPVPQSADTVTVEYKPFGVSLNFTPTILSGDRIALQVKPEVSAVSTGGAAVSAGGFNLPSFVVRKVDTTVEVASGQTFAIAGLFQQSFSRNLEKFPVLGDVPVLGSLFRSERFQKDETELVVLITPYLVEPVRSRDLATPIDRPAKKRKLRKSGNSSMGLIVK